MTPDQLRGLLPQLKAKFPGLTEGQILEELTGQTQQAQQFQELTFDSEVVEDFIASQDPLLGDNWDEATARRTFEALIKNAPAKVKARLRREFNALVSRKGQDGTAGIDQSVLNGNINDGSALIAELMFPGEGVELITKARESGLDLMDYLGTQKTNYAQVMIRAKNWIRNEALKRIRAERAATGKDVPAGRQGIIVGEVINELAAKPELRNQFLPASFRKKQEEQKQQQQSQRQGGPARNTSAKPEVEDEPVTYKPTQQIPANIAKSGVALYEQDDVRDMLIAAANGKPLPSAVKRAAKANGMTTGEFLLQQAGLTGFQVPDGMKSKVEKVARVTTGTEESLAQAAPSNQTPLSVASNVLLNMLTGTGPAVAKTRQVAVVPYGEAPVQVNPNTQYIATTGFGMSADGMTQTLHGLQGRVGYDKNHGVGNDHIHHGAPDKQTALALANYLKNNGVPIWEFAPWGPVSPVHQDPGHYNGMSFDIPVGVEEHDRVLRLIDTFYRTR